MIFHDINKTLYNDIKQKKEVENKIDATNINRNDNNNINNLTLYDNNSDKSLLEKLKFKM